MVCINFKSYSNLSGVYSNEILNIVNDFLSKNPQFKSELAICPNNLQLESLSKSFPEIIFISQGVDAVSSGKTTGLIPAELLNSINVKYTLLNHSEHRIYDVNLITKIRFIEDLGIKTIVCCENLKEAEFILQAKPYAIAYEPPELIGSNISVSTQKPEIVKDFVNLVKDTSLPYIGAGITSGEDIKLGKEYGAKGYLIARAFSDAEDKYQKLDEFLKPSN